MDLTQKLFEIQDKKFQEFNSALIPNIPKDTVIGVKTPELKALAKELIANGAANAFLNQLPHKYFEENQLHAFIICELRSFDDAIREVEKFLPYIDNWATCDQLIPKAFAKDPEFILDKVHEWIKSNKTYTVRFAIGILMRYFLDKRFKTEYIYTVAEIKSDEYYVNMMIAWYFATALAKQYESTLPVFEDRLLSDWVHNKAISKARESRRVSDKHKEMLNKMKV